jgi:hypothetical protein
MSIWLKETGVNLLHWRLAIWKGFNGTLIVALGAIIGTLSNMNWSEMDGQSRFLFICGISLSVLKSLDMLLDQTIAGLRAEDKPA